MSELSFLVRKVRGVLHAAAPTLAVELEVSNRPADEAIESVLLQAQVRIEAPLRAYSEAEREGLRELFGPPSVWGRAVRGLLWAQATAVVRPFRATGAAELLLPCPLELHQAAAKYLHALEAGHIPLLLLFSGTVFHRDGAGALQAAPIPWNAEAGFLLPVSTWTALVDHYFPNQAPLSLGRELLDRLYRYQVDHGLLSLDQAVEALLA